MTQQEVVKLMESSGSISEWNHNARQVRKAFNGEYPNFWCILIIKGGVCRRTLAKFNTSDEIQITRKSNNNS